MISVIFLSILPDTKYVNVYLTACNIVHIQSQYFYILSPAVNAIVLVLCVCLCVPKQPKGQMVHTQNLEKSFGTKTIKKRSPAWA